jgi:ribosomal protein S18 acetylase RimI-like enzyme
MDGADPRLLDLNLLESIREFARWQEGALCLEEDGILLVSGGSESPLGYANCVARVDPETPAELVLDRARDFFGDQERGFTLWSRPQTDEELERAALARGLRQVVESPWMVLSSPFEEMSMPSEARLVHVKDEAGIADAAAVNRDAYQTLAFSAEEVDAIYGRPRRALEPHVAVFVAYRGDEPVSTAMSLHTAGVSGVYWVGTRESARGQGYGEVCTRAAANAGFAAGAQVVTLQATRMGESLYRRLGFRVVAAHRWLVATSAKAMSSFSVVFEYLEAIPLVA